MVEMSLHVTRLSLLFVPALKMVEMSLHVTRLSLLFVPALKMVEMSLHLTCLSLLFRSGWWVCCCDTRDAHSRSSVRYACASGESKRSRYSSYSAAATSSVRGFREYSYHLERWDKEEAGAGDVERHLNHLERWDEEGDEAVEVEQRREQRFATDRALLARPAYMQRRGVSDADAYQRCLENDMTTVSMRVDRHICCYSCFQGGFENCRHEFPKELVDFAGIVCERFAAQLGVNFAHGRRHVLRNCGDLHGTTDALVVCLRFNADVSTAAFRFPVVPGRRGLCWNAVGG
eukprot:gene34460-24749_t